MLAQSPWVLGACAEHTEMALIRPNWVATPYALDLSWVSCAWTKLEMTDTTSPVGVPAACEASAIVDTNGRVGARIRWVKGGKVGVDARFVFYACMCDMVNEL